MRAVRLCAPRDLRIEEIPIPEPGAGEVLMRVAAVGVCRSDIQYYASGRIGEEVMRELSLDPSDVEDIVSLAEENGIGRQSYYM